MAGWSLARGAQQGDTDEQAPTEGALELVSSMLDGAGLPDGVVEIVIADARPPGRCILDIREGRAIAIAPGSAVPWTSISGSREAWMLALGAASDVSQLRHMGEPMLAERVIGVLCGRRALAGEQAGSLTGGAPPLPRGAFQGDHGARSSG